MINNCPNCNNFNFPLWSKLIAVWPFRVRCKNCGVRVRLKIPRWQNITVQILGQFVFWAFLLFGIMLGLHGAVIGGIAGAILAMLIAVIPGFHAELEVVPKRKHS